MQLSNKPILWQQQHTAKKSTRYISRALVHFHIKDQNMEKENVISVTLNMAWMDVTMVPAGLSILEIAAFLTQHSLEFIQNCMKNGKHPVFGGSGG